MNTEFEEKIVLYYLKKNIREGKNYFKSRDIAEDIGDVIFTSKKVASILKSFSNRQMWKFKVSKYTKSGSRHVWKAEVM